MFPFLKNNIENNVLSFNSLVSPAKSAKKTPKSSGKKRKSPSSTKSKTSLETKRKSPKKKLVRRSVTAAMTESFAVKTRSKSEVLSAAPSVVEKAMMSRSLTMTKPVSPKLQIEKRLKGASKVMKSTEDIEFEKIEQAKQQEMQQIKKAKKLYQKLKANGYRSLATKSEDNVVVKKVTVPKTPNSILDKRLGKKVPSALRKSPAKQEEKKLRKQTSGPTIPEPFHFATDDRLQSSTTNETMLSNSLTAAEIAQKFMQDARSHEVPEHFVPKITRPVSPKFQTDLRASAVTRPKIASHDEIEENIMDEIRKNQFKARRLDKRIFESRGELGVPKVSVKAPTIPMEFEFHLDKRAVSPRAPRESEVVPSSTFKARPMPDLTFKKPSTPPAKAQFKPTIAVSPKFHGIDHASAAPERRQKLHHSIVEQQQIEEGLRYSKTVVNQHQITQPVEFNFETANRGAVYQQQLEEQRIKEMEQLQINIKANPMPKFDHVFQPKPCDKAPTEPQPFNLRSIELHEAATEEIEKEKEKLLSQSTNPSFKAKPLPKTTYEPAKLPETVVETPRVPLVPMNITLESDVRAQKRKEYDMMIKQKSDNFEQYQQQMNKQKEDLENRNMKELRRKTIQEGGLVFKAAPILAHDPFPLKGLSQVHQPTVPKSPNFKLKDRRASSALRMTQNNNNDMNNNMSTGLTTAAGRSSSTGKHSMNMRKL